MKGLKKMVGALLLLLLATAVRAQETQSIKFGFLSYNEIFQTMPEFADAQKKMAELKAKYDQEAQRSETEFQRKYAEFLQGQKDFPENILLKRQYELQDLMTQSIKFKEEAQMLLVQAEKDLQAELLLRLNEVIRQVGAERGYAFIINIDGNACPFINTMVGEDATNFVKEKLQIPFDVTQ